MPTTTTRRSATSVALIVLGSILGLFALGLLGGGGAVLWADQTQRDSDGYFTSSSHSYSSGSYAITHEGADVQGHGVDVGRLARLRLKSTGTNGKPVFIGIARERDVDAYLADVSHSRLHDFDLDPFKASYTPVAGRAKPAPPAAQRIWAASSTGSGTQALTWRIKDGSWAVVAMNADGSRGVAADVSVDANIHYLGWIWGGLLAIGALLLALAILMIVRGARGPEAGEGAIDASAAPAGTRTTVAMRGSYPAVLAARLDEPLSRWLWLVKWLLAIPHLIVLAFLWVAFAVLTFVAWIAILVTGRYPRGIFDFNVGVLRWTWRVSYYGYGALGTDRYPPFSLGPEPDYPAIFDVPYPGETSRLLALVRWVLAIPHLLIVGVFAGGGVYGVGQFGGWELGSASFSLIGLVTFVAAIALLVTARYPRGLYDFVMGLNRWVFRVAAYVALMTDEYPPLRFDGGADEQAGAPAKAVPATG